MFYAFDIDGVIVDVTERLRRAHDLSRGNRKLFWDFFFSEELLSLDKPRSVGIKLLIDRARRGRIIIITGRPVRLKEHTLRELLEYTGIKPHAIFMRRNNDLRASRVVKLELLKRAISLGYEVVEYHDDDEEVLRAIVYEFPEIRLFIHEDNTYRLFRP